MKKFFLVSFSTIFLIFLTLFLVIFFKPGLLINPDNLTFVLNKTKVLDNWKWKDAVFVHEWKAWNNRNFSGQFTDFCFDTNNQKAQVEACFEKISWSLNLNFSFGDGLFTKTLEPLVVRSSFLKVIPQESNEDVSSGPPDIWKYWTMLWSDLIPDMDFEFTKIVFKERDFDLKLLKKPQSLIINALDFTLVADPKTITLNAPEAYPFPKKLPLAKQPVYFRDVKLVATMKEEGIPLKLTGSLESILFNVNSYVDLPLKKDPASPDFLKDFILKTKAEAVLTNLRSNLKDYGPRPYNILPAPFNVLDGNVTLKLNSEKSVNPDEVLIKTHTLIDLKSPKQIVNLSILGDVIFNVLTKKTGSINVGLDFEEVTIQLPRLSKKSPPPQFIPDKRFKKKEEAKTAAKEKKDITIDLEAENKEALHIRSNLLDEALRLNFDLSVVDGSLKDGYVKVLPLKTSVFKRPIRVDDLIVKFQAPLEPVLTAQIRFPLPEYKITLNLEGPVSKPRYAFESDPPLPQNDIYAVLLFGRPLADLDPDDKTAASRTNKILSQGILSLSVLYFLAGSPVEYVGYDPGSKNATAQFGLGKKSSLRVGGGSEGVNSTAIRRSLGKGWYIDTSVQNSTENVSGEAKNYGVLLERIISY